MAEDDERQTYDTGRLMALTDGVVAIALTLLILDLNVAENLSQPQLRQALSDLRPQFFALALSFLVIGLFWLGHHRMYQMIKRVDNRLLTLNLVYLAGIAILPFTTELHGDYSDSSLAVAIYAVNVGAIAAVNLVGVRYARRRGLYAHDVDLGAHSAGVERLSILTAVFLISAPIAFISPTAAQLCWASLLLLRFVPLRRSRRANSASASRRPTR